MKTLLLSLLLTQAAGAPPEWTFNVRHDHTFGACEGQLIVSDESVRYETSNPDHVRHWTYPDIQFFEIVSEQELRIHTYESEGVWKVWRDRDFALQLRDGALDGGVYAFLRARSPRPVRTRMIFDSGDEEAALGRILQEIPVRHDHLLGGCQGTLQISENRIAYATDNQNDSRVWLLADLESFASTDRFDLRISTRNETFHFDLKVPLNRETYQHIWNAVYEPQIQTDRGGER